MTVDGTGLALRQQIAQMFWPRLTLQLTLDKIGDALPDSKFGTGAAPRLFLPHDDAQNQTLNYYAQDGGLPVERLRAPGQFDDDYLYAVAREPGLLAMAFEDGAPLAYIVPGGRFREFYGWDSYFIARGLIEDGEWDRAADVATQFAHEITKYGRILNANRPYYLGRSQPPFLTDLAWRLQPRFPARFAGWMHAAIREYHSVWTAAPRFDPATGLSRYTAAGRGIPPEVEPGHFDSVLRPIAARHNMSLSDFVDGYNNKSVRDAELDDFLRHDRAVRESGHDVTSRFYNVCADLATVDLTSLLYKYETDIARAVEQFPSEFPDESAATWRARAEQRRKALTTFHWDAENGRFVDYNLVLRQQHAPCTSATTLWPLWSGCASAEQARAVVNGGLRSVEFDGGVASTSKLPAGEWQWDYPAGWAPHQLLAWEGLENYGYGSDAQRLARNWLGTVSRAYNQTDGAVFEKYDVTGVDAPQNVRAEYGNQGNNETGFGWTNAAFAIGWDRYALL